MRFEYKQFEIDDDEGENLHVYFDSGTEFIHKHREYGAVLVHCAAGISRSASLVIAYLIRYENMNYDTAFAKVKEGREFINPNRSFEAQLRAYSDSMSLLQKPQRSHGPANCAIA